MAKVAAGLALLLLLLCWWSTPVQAADSVECFYYDKCGGCAEGCGECEVELTVTQAVQRSFAKDIEQGARTFTFYNTAKTAQAQALLEQRCADAGLRPGDLALPAFFTSQGEVFQGENAVEQLAEYYGVTPEGLTEEQRTAPGDHDKAVAPGDSVVLYFYKPDCPYCTEVEPLLQALPASVRVEGKQSPVKLLTFNKHNPQDMELVQKYYTLLNIPEERQYVPMVIVGNSDLFLEEEIAPGLLPALEAGQGLDTPLFVPRTRPALWPFFVAGATAAGVIFLLLHRKKEK